MTADEYYTDAVHGPHEYHDLGAFELDSGFLLPGAKIAYQTAGTLNADKDNAILLPHMYSGTSAFMHTFIGEGRPLDPSKYFFIMPGQFGGGFSSSPSNQPPPFDRGSFPPVTISDDVRAQHSLVTDRLGINELALVSGWSMGGQQTYEWAVRYPDLVKRGAVFAANARTPEHNLVFGLVNTDAIRSDPAWSGGFYEHAGQVHAGLRRHAHIFALMGATPDVYRQEVWRELGHVSRDDFIQGFLEAYFLPMDPNNLLSQSSKWRAADVSAHADGDLAAALARITAKMTIVAFTGDTFFPPQDIAAEAALIPGAEFDEIGTVWGHFTMFSLREQDVTEMDDIYRKVLAN